MQQLSSRVTPVTKFVFPAVFLAMFPVWVFVGLTDPRAVWAPFFWGAFCAFAVWWTLPIKKVALDGDQLVIGNFRSEIAVPTAHLREVREDRGNRTPNLTLIFDPPTAFGRKIRLIPPLEMFSRKEFDRVAELLRSVAVKNA